jgi:hypothetical protein
MTNENSAYIHFFTVNFSGSQCEIRRPSAEKPQLLYVLNTLTKRRYYSMHFSQNNLSYSPIYLRLIFSIPKTVPVTYSILKINAYFVSLVLTWNIYILVTCFSKSERMIYLYSWRNLRSFYKRENKSGHIIVENGHDKKGHLVQW